MQKKFVSYFLNSTFSHVTIFVFVLVFQIFEIWDFFFWKMSDLQNIPPACTIEERDLYQNINTLKNIRNEFDELTLTDTAVFFTDKLVTLTNQSKDEVYQMAKLLLEKEEFHRAAFYITSRNLHLQDISCRHLAAKCYVCFFRFFFCLSL